MFQTFISFSLKLEVHGIENGHAMEKDAISIHIEDDSEQACKT